MSLYYCGCGRWHESLSDARECCPDDDRLRADGGRVRRADAMDRCLAGVGDQASGCPHGETDCSGPGGPGLSCSRCFFDGDSHE